MAHSSVAHPASGAGCLARPRTSDIRRTADGTAVRSATRRDGLRSTVKVIDPAHLNPDGLMRLRNEAKLLHEMDDPHIVKLHGWYEEEDAFYMALEPCDGQCQCHEGVPVRGLECCTRGGEGAVRVR